MTYVCRACVCVCRPPSPFSACVHHPSVRTLAYTYHSSRLSTCVCVCRSPSPFSACVHHPSVRTLAYTYHSSRLSACVCVFRPPSRLCTCVHRPCACVCACVCIAAAVALQRVRAPSSVYVRSYVSFMAMCVYSVLTVFVSPRARAAHARRRSDAPFDDDGCSPECASPTHHDAYTPRCRIPSRLQASATNPEDYVTDHQIWLGLLLVCDGRHCLSSSLARAALIGRSVWVNRPCFPKQHPAQCHYAIAQVTRGS